MKKKIITLVVLVLVLAFGVAMLSACTDNDSTNKEETVTKTLTEAEAEQLYKDAAKKSDECTSYAYEFVYKEDGVQTSKGSVKFDGSTYYSEGTYKDSYENDEETIEYTHNSITYYFVLSDKYYKAGSSTTTYDKPGSEPDSNKYYKEITESEYTSYMKYYLKPFDYSDEEESAENQQNEEEEEENEDKPTYTYSASTTGNTTILTVTMERKTEEGGKVVGTESFEIKDGVIVKTTYSELEYDKDGNPLTGSYEGISTYTYGIAKIALPNEADFQETEEE